jgi:hypothetical protein
MAAKIAGYLAYYEQGLHARKHPGMQMQAFVVATVTQTRSRAEELRKELHPLLLRNSSRHAYPFIAFDDLAPVSLLPATASNAA